MKRHTETEENYLKCILRQSVPGTPVSTNAIAHNIGTSPASVTDMMKKLADKELVNYTPYKGVTLTANGQKIALKIIRKHRLWEVFLVQKLNFSWDNVHDVAEQLEHIESPELIRALDTFLNYPKFDPHGDPIPSETGEIVRRNTMPLGEAKPGELVRIAGVKRSDQDFLQYLDRVGLTINQQVKVQEHLPFDQSLQLDREGHRMVVSGMVASNLLVLPEENTA